MRTTRLNVLAATFAALLPGTASLGTEITPQALLERVAGTYASLQTYRSEGTIASAIETGGVTTSVSTSFTILLKKPNLYRVTWSQAYAIPPGLAQAGAVWNDGTGPRLYLGAMNAYGAMDSDMIALSGATGVSGGAAFTVPSLFLSVWTEPCDPRSRLSNPVLEEPEVIDGQDCYVLSGTSAASKKETYWIAKSDFLIRQYRRSLEPPAGGLPLPEPTDEQIEKTLRLLGQEVTEGRKKEMRETMKAAKQMLKTIKISGVSTELHTAVSSPQLSSADFEFVPPAGATRKESLFGGVLEPRRGVSAAAESAAAIRLATTGAEMQAAEAERLERQLEQNPDDVAARTKLLGYTLAKPAAAARRTHVLWFIRNRPEHPILGFPYGGLDAGADAEGYAQGKAAWLAHLAREPENLKLLEHAARYFLCHDRDLARSSLEKARSLDRNNPKWHRELGQLAALEIGATPETSAAARALEHYEAAYALSDAVAKDALLQQLARTALAADNLAKAGHYAEEMLRSQESSWNAGNNIHHGNVTLGRIALRSGDVEGAKMRLLEAGRTPGSPQLDSFGPTMSLASELLERGEKETVLSYFELCAKFWESGKKKLAAWTAAVHAGTVPDFGPNLRY